MPQPYEQGDRVGRLRIVERVRRGYSCRCTKCKHSVTVAARSLRTKRGVDCARCFPARRQPRSQVFYTQRGWPTVNDTREAA